MNPISFNPFVTVKDGPIRKQAFGTSKKVFIEMKARLIDSGFKQDGEITREGQYFWCQMIFVGRDKVES